LKVITRDGSADVALGGSAVTLPRLPSGSAGPSCGGICVTRLAGPDRYATAVESSWFLDSQKTLVIASGERFADAIVGGPLGAKLGIPIVLTNQSRLPASTRERIRARSVRKVLLLGGTAAVDSSVFNELDRVGVSVTRLWGLDRYDTAVAVSRQWQAGDARTVVLASGDSYHDQLVAARVAAARGGPLLLVRPDGSVPAGVLAELKRLGPTIVMVVGTVGPTSKSLIESAVPTATVTILSASTPSDLAVAAAEQSGMSFSSVVIATSDQFPDGLAAVPLAASRQEPLLFMNSSCVPSAVAELLQRSNTRSLTILGGPAAVVEGAEKLEKICAQ